MKKMMLYALCMSVACEFSTLYSADAGKKPENEEKLENAKDAKSCNWTDDIIAATKAAPMLAVPVELGVVALVGYTVYSAAKHSLGIGMAAAAGYCAGLCQESLNKVWNSISSMPPDMQAMVKAFSNGLIVGAGAGGAYALAGEGIGGGLATVAFAAGCAGRHASSFAGLKAQLNHHGKPNNWPQKAGFALGAGTGWLGMKFLARRMR